MPPATSLEELRKEGEISKRTLWRAAALVLVGYDEFWKAKKDTRGFCRVSRRELDPVESTEWHPVQEDASFNRGTHVLHFGGEYDSHLLVPKV